jgi:LysM repeat protein
MTKYALKMCKCEILLTIRTDATDHTKSRSTGDFCYSIMESWQDQDNLTEEQSCSDCLLGMLSLDQSSGFSYNAAFESNFSAMTASCGKTGYEPTKPTPIALNSSIEATTIPTPSCVSSYTVRADDTCGAISNANNVSTFALTLANELDAYCQGPLSVGTELCIPVSCDIYTVRQNDTCRSVAASQPSYITITQLQAWNPNLNRLCTNMEQQVDTQVCVGPPGGTLAAPSNTAAQPSAPTTTASVPADIANGTNVRCAKYYTVVAGDTCGDITIRNGISLSDFYFLNAGINSECTNLFAQESYCILPVGNIATYSGYG